MDSESLEKPNLRPIYNKIDTLLKEKLIYPSKYKGQRKPVLINRLLKRKGNRTKDESIRVFHIVMKNNAAEIERFFDDLESAGLSRADASQVLYDRILHNASKHLKFRYEDVEVALKESNSRRLKTNKHSRLIPPYLVKEEDQEQLSAENANDIKSIALTTASKPYALRSAVNAYDSYISMVKKGYVEDPDIDVVSKSARATRKSYYERLLEQNKKRKKFPKKSLTEFEKRGLEVFHKLYSPYKEIRVAERHLEKCKSNLAAELKKSYMQEVNIIGSEVWESLASLNHGPENTDPQINHLARKALQKIQRNNLSLKSMQDSSDPDFKEIEEIIKEVSMEFVTERQADLATEVTRAKVMLKAVQKEKIELKSEEKALLESFVSYTTDNRKFNRRMRRVLSSSQFIDRSLPKHYQQGIYNSASLIHKHSHKTKGFKRMKSLKSKLSKIVSRMNKKEEILESERMSLAEIGMIERFNRNTELFETMEAISPESPEIKDMIEQQKELAPLEESFYQHIEDDGAKTFKTGDIILDSSKLRRELDGKKADLFDRVTEKITKYDHAAVAWARGEETYKSHVTLDDIEATKESGAELLISEHYRIHPEVMLKDNKMKEDLKLVVAQEGAGPLDPNGPKLTEKELSEQLGEMFSAFASQVHSEIQQGKLVAFENPAERQMRAGMADLIPVLGHKKNHSNMSWVRKVTGRSEEQGMDLRQALLEDTGGEMICSEYAARVTLLSLVRLDDALKEKMEEKGAEVKTKGVMSLPLVREKLSKVHPERLLKTLPKGAVERVESGLAKSAIKGI